MNLRCRVMGLLLVALALFQSIWVLVDAWHARQWPQHLGEWVHLALLPVALWVYARYFSAWGRCRCNNDECR